MSDDPDPFDGFDMTFLDKPAAEVAAPPPVVPPIDENEDAHTRFMRTALLGNARQREILSTPIDENTDPRTKRLQADVAHQAIKTAIQIDEARFRTRQDDILPRILAEVAIQRAKLAKLEPSLELSALPLTSDKAQDDP